VASILLAVAVGLGAFGAHGLKGRLDAYSMGIYEKAVFYHFVHALGMLIASLVPFVRPAGTILAGWACVGLLVGIVLFSGSLYALALTGIRSLGMVTPLGGIAFILGWIVLASAFSRG
jgi:uncharacterized membrane protein YgdD (TMEM256/DUF423 family)